jgi:hypothetical protein
MKNWLHTIAFLTISFFASIVFAATVSNFFQDSLTAYVYDTAVKQYIPNPETTHYHLCANM